MTLRSNSRTHWRVIFFKEIGPSKEISGLKNPARVPPGHW